MVSPRGNQEGIWNRSIFCVMAVALSLSLDYSLTLITFQAFWLSVGGRPELSGLVFGSYDVLTIILGPLLGLLVELSSFRTLFLLAVAINAIGDVIYCFGAVANSWIVLLIGRLVAGLGASAFPLTMAYVAAAFDRSHQIDAVGYVKYAASLARIIGPLASSALVSIPVPARNASVARLLFSGLTVPCWIAAALGVACFGTIFFLFRNPRSKGRRSAEQALVISDTLAGNGKKSSTFRLVLPFVPIWLAQFVATAAYWSYGSNLLLLAAMNYHMVSSESELWKLYLGGAAGLIGAFVSFLYLKRRITPVSFVCVGFACQAMGALLLSPFPYPTEAAFIPPLHSSLFHCAVTLSTLGYGLLVPGITALNNIQAQSLERFGSLFVTLIISFGAVARFAGPALFSGLVTFRKMPGCDLTDGHEYKTDACHLHNLGTFIAVIEALLLFSMLLTLWTLAPKRIVPPELHAQRNPRTAVSNGEISDEVTTL